MVFLGVLSISASSVIFKFATADPLVVAFYRLALTALILAFPLMRQRPGSVATRDLLLTILSGVLLAAHFGTWFFSLTLTSVASSTLLVSMHPFLVLVFGYCAWGDRPGGKALAGVVLAVVGAIIVGWGDFAISARAVAGDALAFLGAVTVGGYLLIGRTVRQRVGTLLYSVTAYASAALVLLLAAVLWGGPLIGFEPLNWAVFTALAIFPTIFGHTLFNWALRYVPASVVSVNILGEPVGATLLAYLIWRIVPPVTGMVGGVMILVGIAMFLRYYQSPKNAL